MCLTIRKVVHVFRCGAELCCFEGSSTTFGLMLGPILLLRFACSQTQMWGALPEGTPYFMSITVQLFDVYKSSEEEVVFVGSNIRFIAFNGVGVVPL